MPEYPAPVSVTAPLTPAFERMKALLFQPFDLSVWLAVGLCAWLARLGRFSGGGGGGSGFRGNGNQGPSITSLFEQAKDYVLSNLQWIIPVAIAVMLIALLIWLVFTWLSSRGEFMFLHCVATRRAEVVLPWNRYGRHAQSLFLFRAALGLALFVVGAPLLLGSVWTIDQLLTGEGEQVLRVPVLILTFTSLAGLGLLFALIQKLALDFVVPIMFLHTGQVLEGWRRLLRLMSGNVGAFALYILFSLLLWIGLGIVIVAVVILTCCCAGCLMAIPYLGTVLLLPVYVFVRAYSAEYLAQYGPEFNVFAHPVEPTTGLLQQL